MRRDMFVSMRTSFVLIIKERITRWCLDQYLMHRKSQRPVVIFASRIYNDLRAETGNYRRQSFEWPLHQRRSRGQQSGYNTPTGLRSAPSAFNCCMAIRCTCGSLHLVGMGIVVSCMRINSPRGALRADVVPELH